jgi:ankyrin repeat protein
MVHRPASSPAGGPACGPVFAPPWPQPGAPAVSGALQVAAWLVVGASLLAALAGFIPSVRVLVASRPATTETVQRARAALSNRALRFTPEAYTQAAARGDRPALKLYLAAGMPVDALDPRGPRTALAAAARAGQAAAVEQLLAAGADASAGAGRWGSALHEAAATGHTALVHRLLRERPAAAALDEAFLGAARQGRPAVLRLLLDHGVDVARLRQGGLAVAASQGSADPLAQSDTIALLLQAGADPRAAEPDTGLTPLHRAAYEGQVASAIALLDHGADPNARDAEGCTPLWWAAGAGRAGMVALLLARGADAQAASDDGTTVQDRAQGHRDAAALLQRLPAGAAR